MIRISAPHFTAGVVITGGQVSRYAPILYYMINWTPERVIAYCERKRWRWELFA